MSVKLKYLARQYIEQCDSVINNNNQELAKELQLKIISTFENYIKNINNNLKKSMGGTCEVNYIENVMILKCKIEAFEANDCKIIDNENCMLTVKNENRNENTNKNENKNEIELHVMFSNIRDEIKNSNYLGEAETKEILEKVDFIENINKTSDSKKEKWSKLKPILTWISTKGVGIAIPILGIIEAVLKDK